jgi:hypothetical protein
VFSLPFTRRPRALCAALAVLALGFAAAPLATPVAARTAARAASRPSPHPAHAAHDTRTAKRAAPKKQVGWHPHPGNAPADEYFGRLGMSILGVRNKVKDLGLDADLHPNHDVSILGNALWVEDAMRDWAKKYPYDHWLPRYAFALEQMYEEIPGGDAHKRAVKQLGYITAYFPTTIYGKVGRAKLAMGIPTPAADDPPPIVETDLQRLALLDGKVLPTLPPAPTPPSATPAATLQAPPADSGAPATPGAVLTPAPSTTTRP